jgi:type II secretory pathway pseudopilin PulG
MRATRDRGESLLELIVAVTIMGIAVVAIVGSLGTAVLMSDIHRKQATAGASARDYAEAVETAVATTGYVACASSYPTGFSAPTGYVASGSMAYWNGTGWQATCTTDTGVQQFTAQVASGDGRAVESVVVVLRRPCIKGTTCS